MRMTNRVAMFGRPIAALSLAALSLAALSLATSTLLAPASAQPVEDFYRGKTIKVIVPTGPGGTYALFGNIINDFMQKHIPGNPNLIMQFIPSGIQATNYLYNVSAKDGLTIGMLSQSAGLIQVLTPEHVKYDLRKIFAIGLFSQLNAVLTVPERTPAKTVQDLKTIPTSLGATDTSSYQYMIPQTMNRYLGTKLKVITGYKGIAETTLAMERGEVDGVFTSWLAIKEKRTQTNWQHDKGRILLQVGYNSEADLDAPLLDSFAADDKAAQAFAFIRSFSALSRCLIAPPDIPADRLAVLRKAVADTNADPEFAAALEKRGLPYRPLTWQVQQQIMNETVATSRDLVD
jgi:tripartite-type tricarboxylate transporter receptor subunit TctC